MSIDQQRRILARQLRPLAVRQYAESRQWSPVEGVRGRFWLFRHPEQHLRQLQIPMDAEDANFTDAMLDVVQRIAELERRSIDAVLADLQWPDADILRVRVASRDAESGQLSLAADVMLREGARRALLASACSVINPVAVHPRMSRGEADVMLAACRAGQTEVGSYVLKIICPLHAVPRELELPDATPFTRKVTTHLMRATADLVDSIEHSRVEDLPRNPRRAPHAELEPLRRPLTHAARAKRRPTRALDHLGRRSPPAPTTETRTPSRVAIKAEYIPEIQRAAQILRPSPAANREEMLIGTVEILSGVVGPDGRRSGEVQFSVFLPDSDPLRVRANLAPEQYADAVRAHESGRAYVRLHGVLHRGQRIGRIDPLRALQLLDE
jgi:hypothetical protein